MSATRVLNEVEATVDDSALGAELDELQELEQTESDQPAMSSGHPSHSLAD